MDSIYRSQFLHLGWCLQQTPFFLSPKLSYVLFILARDHLGKLVFAGDGKISFEICSTQFPTYYFSKYVTHTSRRLEEPAHALRGLEELFLELCSFWFWQEIGFGFTYYLCT
jgi:hypothetical protein